MVTSLTGSVGRVSVNKMMKTSFNVKILSGHHDKYDEKII
jgi:hypothetical protein